MPKIRADLIGVVLAAGHNYAAGDTVPDDAPIHASLLEDGHQEPKKPAQSAEKAAESDEESEEDYSDLLGGDDAEKPAPKRSTGRRTSSRKG